MAAPRDPMADRGASSASTRSQPGEGRSKRRPLPAARRIWQEIVPESLLGLAALLFFMALAAAFSGAILFAYYRFELEDTRERVTDVESRVADDLEAARQILDTDRQAAIDEIGAQLDELEKFAASGATLADLLEGASPSVFFVNSLDENGQPSVGSAFVLFSDSEQSFLLTSFTTVRAATRSPGPSVTVTKNGQTIPVTLNGWDEARDLALLVADVANLPPLERAEPRDLSAGDRVFAVSGLGAAGGSIVQGVVADTSANAIQHDTPIGPHFQGGPLLDSQGRLVAIASRAYAPLNFATDAVFFGIPWREACTQVVQCPDGVG